MKVIPTLTLDGFVSDVNTTILKIYQYFVTSDYSQSVMYFDNISSLKYLIGQAGSDLDKLEDDISETLYTMCQRYCDDVTVDVEITTEKISETKHSNNIKINITVIEDGVTYDLERSVIMSDNKILKINDDIEYLMS